MILKSQQTVDTAQIVKVNAPDILLAKTEDGRVYNITPSENQSKDWDFWRIMRNIAHSGLWLPLTRDSHQLMASDWIA